MKKGAEHAGIGNDIHTHTLRHTFAAQLCRRRVPLETIKDFPGHADIRETPIYAHFSPDEARTAIPKIDSSTVTPPSSRQPHPITSRDNSKRVLESRERSQILMASLEIS